MSDFLGFLIFIALAALMLSPEKTGTSFAKMQKAYIAELAR